jgi:hypothetical protein
MKLLYEELREERKELLDVNILVTEVVQINQMLELFRLMDISSYDRIENYFGELPFYFNIKDNGNDVFHVTFTEVESFRSLLEKEIKVDNFSDVFSYYIKLINELNNNVEETWEDHLFYSDVNFTPDKIGNIDKIAEEIKRDEDLIHKTMDKNLKFKKTFKYKLKKLLINFKKKLYGYNPDLTDYTFLTKIRFAIKPELLAVEEQRRTIVNRMRLQNNIQPSQFKKKKLNIKY